MSVLRKWELNLMLYLCALPQRDALEGHHFVIKCENETKIVILQCCLSFLREQRKQEPFPRDCLEERENENERPRIGEKESESEKRESENEKL